MKKGDAALTPDIAFTGTKANIEAVASPIEGMQALATDTHERGAYDNGAWVWSALTGGGYTPPATTAANDFQVGDGGAGAWIKKTLAETAAILDDPLMGVFPLLNHDHSGAGINPTPKLAQANTHESPDTDSAAGSLHHTIGSGANQAAAGNHTHSGLVTAETNANMIYQVSSPGAISTFTAKLNGDPTNVANSVCTFDNVVAPGVVGVITPVSTSQLAKMRMYNTTRSNSALILDAAGATFTTTTNVYALGWRDNDDITITSTTVSGGGYSWFDLEITSGPTDKTELFLEFLIVSATVGDSWRLHPLEAYAASKMKRTVALVATYPTIGYPLLKITSNVFSAAWTGTPTSCQIMEAGYLS